MATGTGPLPPEYGLPHPRVAHGDRAVVRNGTLSAEALLAPRPPRPFLWGAPDVHFLKVLSLCLMTFAALMVVIRERIAELKLAKVVTVEEHDIFKPLPARWVGHAGFTDSSAHRSPIAAKDLERIKRFPGKVRDLKEREVAVSGILAMLGTRRSEMVDVFGSGGLGSGISDALIGTSGGIEGGVVGGVYGGTIGVGGLGTRGTGAGGGGTGIGLGSIGTIGRVSRFEVDHRAVNLSTTDPVSRRIFASARSRVSHCLDGFEGAMTTDLDLFDDGRVKSVVVSGPPEDVQRCVARALEPLHFPAGDVAVSARWTTG